MDDTPPRPDPWHALRAHTAARIALGRSGQSLPTAEWLRFGLAHAQARDAVHERLDGAALAAQLQDHGFDTLAVASAAADRPTYLRRPDLGRQLHPTHRAMLQALPAAATARAADLLCVLADGLSARAAQQHGLPLLRALRPRLEAAGLRLGPVVLATQARVALGDEIGELLQARVVLMLLGERPGLSSPDSLGAYLTWAPRPGRMDAERNCVSNIRPEGLPPEQAAHKLAWLIGAARQLGGTGVALKDDSDQALGLPGSGTPRRDPWQATIPSTRHA